MIVTKKSNPVKYGFCEVFLPNKTQSQCIDSFLEIYERHKVGRVGAVCSQAMPVQMRSGGLEECSPSLTARPGQGGEAAGSVERRSRRQEEDVENPALLPPQSALSLEEMEFAAEIDELAADTLTESKLWRIAGTRNLASVTALELVVDTSRQTVEDLGHLVPNLSSLTLDGSAVSSIRDLGTALKSLHTLSLNGSGLEELDGMSALPELLELHLRDNRLSELTGLCMHDTLQVSPSVHTCIDRAPFISSRLLQPSVAVACRKHALTECSPKIKIKIKINQISPQVLDLSNNCICDLEAVEILGTAASSLPRPQGERFRRLSSGRGRVLLLLPPLIREGGEERRP